MPRSGADFIGRSCESQRVTLRKLRRIIFDVALKTSDYYTKDIGTWGGKGAEIFGLEGEVERKVSWRWLIISGRESAESDLPRE